MWNNNINEAPKNKELFLQCRYITGYIFIITGTLNKVSDEYKNTNKERMFKNSTIIAWRDKNGRR